MLIPVHARVFGAVDRIRERLCIVQSLYLIFLLVDFINEVPNVNCVLERLPATDSSLA